MHTIGSKTSTTEEFLKAVKPKIALIGVGESNKFGHPNKEVVERLNKAKCKIYRTDIEGEVILEVKKINMQLKIVAKIIKEWYNIYE